MKKAIKWIGIAVLTPILLFIILAVLIYLPPVQNWVVRQVASIASEKTGMKITVEHVNLEFPLDLGIEGFRAIKQNDSLPQLKDTIADIQKLVADVRLLPLLKKQVVIDKLSLHRAKINTNGFISDVRIKGELDELWISSKGIDLDKETAEVTGGRLSDASIDIALSDTAAADTTPSTHKWLINADKLTISRSDLTIHLTGDTLNVRAYMGQAVAQDALIDLEAKRYLVNHLNWQAGRLNYDDRWAPQVKGFDYNHIALSQIDAEVDSFSFTPSGISFLFRQAVLKEKCGIDITHLTGKVELDSTYNNIRLPGMTLKTPDSDIYAETDLDFNIIDSLNPGNMFLRLNAQLGKQDLIKFMGDLPQQFIEHYPNHPIAIRGSVNGSVRQLDFAGLDINLPTAFHLTANGTAGQLTNLSKLNADLKLSAQAKDMNFLTAFVDPKMSGTYRIPNGLTLDGILKINKTNYLANFDARDENGSAKIFAKANIPVNAKGELATNQAAYDVDLKVNNLNLHHFMPKDSLYTLSGDIKAKGFGTDFLSNRSHLTADATISQLQYGHLNLTAINATARLQDGRGQIDIEGHNELFDGTIGSDLLLSNKQIEGTISAHLKKADLYQMRLVEKPLTIGMSGDIKVFSDTKQTHQISGLLDNLYFKDSKRNYHPEKVGLLLKTNPDTTYARIQSGDFIAKLDASGYYERVLKQISVLSDSVISKYEQNIIDQPAIKRLLPTMKLHVESKRNNPVIDLLKTRNIDFKELKLDIAASPATGINGTSFVYSLNYDSTRIDTIRLNLVHKKDRLTYQGQIRNNRKNPQFVFNALFDGHFHEHGALAGLRYYDRDNKLGVRIGVTAEMESDGLRLQLMPNRPTIGYKEFNLNKDNYIFFDQNKKIQAKVDLVSDDKTGLKIYTENQDSTMLQDLTVSLHRIDLAALTSVLPYVPRMTGSLNGDYHILQDQNEKFSVVSDMAVANMTYEDSPIGNLSSEFVYLMKEDNAHAIEARLMLNEEEFGLLSGSYLNEGEGNLDATFKMTRLPLSLINGFVPDQIVGLEGFGEGELDIKGTLSHPDVNGEIYVDSAYLVSVPYSVRMRLDSDPVRIVGSHLLLENYGFYAYNDEPLNVMGSVDFSDINHINVDMRMRARNLLLINAKQEPKSIAYGKAFVNFFARLTGPIEEMNMRGRLDVLSETDMTYILLDSPLSADNKLNELVKFTDFSDSTQTVITRPTPSGVNVDINISVSQGAHIICNLNADQTNYIDLTGGGDLRMKYNSDGINLTGRYTLANGEMKYSLPVIPLKTFTIKDGSYVEFTGDPMNPKLNITATEQVKSTVYGDNGQSRSVLFDCGVIITKTLNDMGLAFTIEALEDNYVKGELGAMSTEERGKVAVAMLTTGMYLAGDTGSSISMNSAMNSALSSFLQSEINNIAGSALKTVDVSMGIDNTTDATGNMRTDYSFKFSKRFFNNRLRVQIGGKVSTGSADYMGQTQSFFDNVSMEYRLNKDATQYIKLFYKQNSFDWLEGYNSEYGAGFIWRKKMDKFWDIFRIKKPQMLPTTIKR